MCYCLTLRDEYIIHSRSELFRVYLEARRLERRPLVTECSLNLFVEHLPENNAGNDAEEVDDYEENPDVIIISSSHALC